MKKGLLLINLGTPDDSSVEAVRRYLDEFLMDPFVVDLPYPLRFLLVKGIILRFRPKRSAELYQKIWLDEGSPLLVYSEQLLTVLQQELKNNYSLALGMRYGKPSIAAALEQLQPDQLDELTVLPLFPQYSEAATESAIQAFHRAYKNFSGPKAKIIRDFYNHPAFIDAYAEIISQHYNKEQHEHLLLSYHGLPVKHLEKIGCEHVGKHCLDAIGCPKISSQNRDCYRAQCYATSHAITNKLNFNSNEYSVSFQSRLGKTPWIKPYTDLHLAELYNKGIRKLAIASPSFVTDCLETLEELAIRAKEQWLELGGESLTVIPCLNSHRLWIKALAQII
jgi:ferrochelatase